MRKLRVGLVFGGRSGEHEVSIRSAASIYKLLDKDKYEIELIGVDKNGGWHVVDQKWLPSGSEMKSLAPANTGLVSSVDEGEIVKAGGKKIDVFFPIIHGSFGEDGSLQGFFELLDVAYVGSGVLGSAVGMDKDVSKRLLLQAGLKVAKFVVLRDIQELDKSLAQIRKLGWPIFVKPVNMGSSVGVTKVLRENDLKKAILDAFKYDTKVIVEEAIVGREIECSVLGNGDPIASVPGEIKSTHDFYDYEAKYIDENGAELIIPADLTNGQSQKIQQTALAAYKILECSGMARVDMFFTKKGEILINEINTLPGFTNISMYPQLWEKSGISYPDLLDRLIRLALDKKDSKDGLKRGFG